MQGTTAIFLALAVLATAADGSGSEGGDTRISVPDGERVRVSFASQHDDQAATRKTLVGIVVRSGSEALWVKPPGGETILVQAAAIDRVEVSRGWRSRKRGAALGAGVGVAAGLIATAAVGGSCDRSAAECGFGTSVTAFVYTPLAMALGALIGAAIPPSERWEEVREDPSRVRVQPLVPQGGLGVAVRVEF